MKLSVSIVDKADDKAPFLLRGGYFDSVKLAKEIGYDAIELHIRDPKSINPHKLKEACDKENIAVSSIGTGLARGMDGLGFMLDDKEIRAKTIGRMRDFIETAEIFDAVVIIGLIKGIIMPGQDYATCEARVVNMLDMCLEEAEKRKVTLVLEAINRYESNFLVNVDTMLDFIQKFKSDYLKVHLDSFHMNIEEPSMADSIIKCGAYLGHMHFADSDRMYPGHGHIDFKKLIDALDKVGYTGYIAIECLALPDPLTAAKKAVNYLRK